MTTTERVDGVGLATTAVLPVGLVPTPTPQYQAYRAEQALVTAPVLTRPGPAGSTPEAMAAAPAGTRILMWKQDPMVSEIGVRKAHLPGAVLTGPRDARIVARACHRSRRTR